MQVSITGIKPTGTPHLGNYLGTIRPALSLAERTEALCFIADYHALTTIHDPRQAAGARRSRSPRPGSRSGSTPSAVGALPPVGSPRGVRAGVDPVLCHAEGSAEPCPRLQGGGAGQPRAGRDDDAGVNMGLFNYPVLMAADILHSPCRTGAGRAGPAAARRDRARHRAARSTPVYGEVLRAAGGDDRRRGDDDRRHRRPQDEQELRQRRADPLAARRPPPCRHGHRHRLARADEPKDPDRCNVFNLYRHVAPPADADELARRYRAGGVGYREAKDRLFDALDQAFREPRARYEALVRRPGRDRVRPRTGRSARPSACATRP